MSLSLRGVGYRYAGSSRPALLDVDLDLGNGEVVGLLGASEAGKSTLCLVVAGLAPRTVGGRIRGAITLDGADVDAWPMHRVAEQVGIGFQNPATQLSQVSGTVFEEVAFGPMNLGLPLDEVVDRTWTALAGLRIEPIAERDPAQLSGGQQQLVAMAGLMAMRPAHLVLDEPTAQLDPAGTRLVGEAIAGLAAGGTGILLAEQKTDIVAEVAGRTVVLEAGRIALMGNTADVLADPRLPSLGVTPPSAVRLRGLLAEAGLDPRALGAAIE
jgi:energy-coupling factor transporter ATP-binding protein EcfA2